MVTGSGSREELPGGRERTLGVSAWELGLQVWSLCRNSRSLIYKVCAHPTLAATSQGLCTPHLGRYFTKVEGKSRGRVGSGG